MEEKVFYQPGDLVCLRHALPNAPIMLVVDKVVLTIKSSKNSYDIEKDFKGIKCRWFTTYGKLEEAVWNTKDLQKFYK